MYEVEYSVPVVEVAVAEKPSESQPESVPDATLRAEVHNGQSEDVPEDLPEIDQPESYEQMARHYPRSLLTYDAHESEHPPRLITVSIKTNGSLVRDKRRLKNIHGVLISFPGRDMFSLQIFEGDKGHLIDFPNYNTRICDEMLDRLKIVLGNEDWRIEEIGV